MFIEMDQYPEYILRAYPEKSAWLPKQLLVFGQKSGLETFDFKPVFIPLSAVLFGSIQTFKVNPQSAGFEPSKSGCQSQEFIYIKEKISFIYHQGNSKQQRNRPERQGDPTQISSKRDTIIRQDDM